MSMWLCCLMFHDKVKSLCALCQIREKYNYQVSIAILDGSEMVVQTRPSWGNVKWLGPLPH